jgi:hypothetical protein
MSLISMVRSFEITSGLLDLSRKSAKDIGIAPGGLPNSNQDQGLRLGIAQPLVLPPREFLSEH